MKKRVKRKPTLIFSMILLLAVLVWAALSATVLLIPTVSMLLVVVFFVSVACYFYLGTTTDELMEYMTNGVKGSMQGIFFFFLIGAIVSVWMLSGCLPTIIHYGLDLLSPRIFLPTVFVLNTLVGFCTGSTWTTVATTGMVSMGIGAVLGVPTPLCAGCCISGAIAGDKICPISETTNMAATSAGTDVYSNVRAMIPTHFLAWIIALVIFFVTGLGFSGTEAQMEQADVLSAIIAEHFNVSPLFMLPILIILVASVMQLPTIPVMAIGVVVSIPFAMLQGYGILDCLSAITNGVSLEFEDPILAEIINRGGVTSMFGTMSIVITALAFGGVMQGAGIFDVLTKVLFSGIRSQRLYPAVGIGVSTLMVFGTADDYPSLTLVGPILSGPMTKWDWIALCCPEILWKGPIL